MIEWSTVAPTAIVALIAGAAGWLTTKIQHRGKPENAIIDQLQETITSDREARNKETAAMKADIAELKTEQAKSKRRERIRDDYINKLRHHIASGFPPPPPEWPEGLND